VLRLTWLETGYPTSLCCILQRQIREKVLYNCCCFLAWHLGL